MASLDPNQAESAALNRLAHELASLGAETPTERQVKRVLPWVISLAIHIGIGLLAILITWTVVKRPSEPQEAPLIVADFNAMNYDPVVRMNASQAPSGVQRAEDRAESKPLDDLIRQAMSSGTGEPVVPLPGAGGSGGADLSQFAPRPSQQGATFIGLTSSNARKIVYAIDASGSMISSNFIVLEELDRSLANLTPQQSFSIVFFRHNAAIELPPGGQLVAATDENKTKAMQWIRTIVPAGPTNPLVAIEKALVLKPDVIFLLSTNITGVGQFEVDQNDLLKLLDDLNPKQPASGRRRAAINCIQFLDQDPLDTMRLIAREHGGPNGFKFLSRQELGLGGP